MKPIIGIPCATLELQGEPKREASYMPHSYIKAVELAGGAPLLIPLVAQESTLQALYARIDGLLLAGGGDIDPIRFGESPHPGLGTVEAQRDWVELTLTPWALADGMPVLAICRGIQTLNVAAGGSLWQDIAAQLPNSLRHPWYPDYPRDRLSHAVQLDVDSRLAEILGAAELDVNSLHHQAVREVGKGLRVTGRAPDGVIEGIEGDGEAWVVGVQWHPECLLDNVPSMRSLFKAFVGACDAYRNNQHQG
jgi:putative glutamine amidotransferase